MRLGPFEPKNDEEWKSKYVVIYCFVNTREYNFPGNEYALIVATLYEWNTESNETTTTTPCTR